MPDPLVPAFVWPAATAPLARLSPRAAESADGRPAADLGADARSLPDGKGEPAPAERGEDRPGRVLPAQIRCRAAPRRSPRGRERFRGVSPEDLQGEEEGHVIVDGRCTHPACRRAYPGSHSRGRKGVLYYARTPEKRAERQLIVSLVDRFGTHLVCPKRECARAGRCRDGHMGALPFCFWHYRGTLRFVIELMRARLAQEGDGAAEEAGPREAPATGTRKPRTSMLAELQAAGWPIERLRRPLDAGPDPYSWELDPDARAILAEARAAAGA
jgi:hypothetical protein